MNQMPNRYNLQLARQSPIQRRPFALAWCSLALLLFSAGCTITPIQPIAPQVTYAVQEGTPATTTEEITETVTIPVTIVGGDEETLRQFLRHYFVQPFAFNNQNHTTLYIDTLPNDLPFDLELPAGLTVAGGVVTTGEYPNSQFFFKVDQEVAENVTLLREQLLNQGYTQPEQPDHQGFQSQSPEAAPLCSPDDTLFAQLNGATLADGSGTIHLYFNDATASGMLCTMMATGGSSGATAYEDVAPSLVPPPNVMVSGSGAGSNFDSYEANITFSGETTIAALAEHYEAQLQAEGWQQIGKSQSEEVTWSGWRRSGDDSEGDAGDDTGDDKEYVMTFYIIRSANSSEHFQSTLRIETAPER